MTRIPVVNDRVLFHPGHDKPPRQARITTVWSPSCVNLVFEDGTAATSVFLAQAYDHNRPAGYFCEYEPAEAPMEAPIPELPAYQGRVVAEKWELDEKIVRLRVFLTSPTFNALDSNERGLLHMQEVAMSTLSTILGQRIAAFKPQGA